VFLRREKERKREREREREQRKWRRCQRFSTTTLVGTTNKIDDKK